MAAEVMKRNDAPKAIGDLLSASVGFASLFFFLILFLQTPIRQAPGFSVATFRVEVHVPSSARRTPAPELERESLSRSIRPRGVRQLVSSHRRRPRVPRVWESGWRAERR